MVEYDFDGSDDDDGHKVRLTNVMSRVGIDMNAVLDPKNCKDWIEAAQKCRKCESIADCKTWSSRTEDGDGLDPPGFCSNCSLLRQFKRGET